jgi:hypothetical protein
VRTPSEQKLHHEEEGAGVVGISPLTFVGDYEPAVLFTPPVFAYKILVLQ